MTTTKQHQRQQYRDRAGRYGEVNKCQRCGKSAGVDYCSDMRTDTNILGVSVGDEALCLCDKCGMLMADMSDEKFLIEIRRNEYGKLPQGKELPLLTTEAFTARAAAGLSDTADMRRTMGQAQADISQSAEAICAECHHSISDHTHMASTWMDYSDETELDECMVDGCKCTMFEEFVDQGDDFDAYMRQLCGDRPDGIIEQYSAATEGRWK